MTPEAELTWIIDEFGARHGARDEPPKATIREHPPIHIQEWEVWHQLARKAVPPTWAKA